jgi:hypothetical protein
MSLTPVKNEPLPSLAADRALFLPSKEKLVNSWFKLSCSLVAIVAGLSRNQTASAAEQFTQATVQPATGLPPLAPAAGPVATADRVMGNWEGSWKNDDGHGDKLTAQVIAEGGDHYRAIFTAYYGQVSIFKVALKGQREQDAVKFGGRVDLGVLFGGVFEWSGGVEADKFVGRYKGQKDIGEFSLQKLHRSSPTLGAKAPEGAIVLFDGKELSAWQGVDGQPAAWKLTDGAMEVTRNHILTREEFGDLKLHLEFLTPFMPEARGQARGNSSIFFQGGVVDGRQTGFEVQILDSFGLEPKDNECAAIYGKKAPSTNASLPPGEWQTFDISFNAPRANDASEVTRKAKITVVHNGVKVIDDYELEGGANRGPILLQDHGDPVRFRNIWLVPGPGAHAESNPQGQ